MLVVRARVVVVFCGREIRDSEPNERRRTLVGELSQCATWAASDSNRRSLIDEGASGGVQAAPRNERKT